MRDSNTKFNLLSTLFIAIAAFGLSTTVYADKDSSSSESTTGFCDCSTSGNLVCHVPPGNPKNMHTIQVGSPAIDAHLAHGDMLGVCPGEDYDFHEGDSSHDSEDQTCTCEDGSMGILYHATPPADPSPAHNLRSITGQ